MKYKNFYIILKNNIGQIHSNRWEEI
jgi:hypothetical protein